MLNPPRTILNTDQYRSVNSLSQTPVSGASVPAWSYCPSQSVLPPACPYCPQSVRTVPSLSVLTPAYPYCPQSVRTVPSLSVLSPVCPYCPQPVRTIPSLSALSPACPYCPQSVRTVPSLSILSRPYTDLSVPAPVLPYSPVRTAHGPYCPSLSVLPRFVRTVLSVLHKVRTTRSPSEVTCPYCPRSVLPRPSVPTCSSY